MNMYVHAIHAHALFCTKTTYVVFTREQKANDRTETGNIRLAFTLSEWHGGTVTFPLNALPKSPANLKYHY